MDRDGQGWVRMGGDGWGWAGHGGGAMLPTLKKLKKNNIDKEGPPSSRPSGGSGGRSPLGKRKKRVYIIHIYIYIYCYMGVR